MSKEKIKISNIYFDNEESKVVFQTLAKKSFTAKTSYFLARVFDKLQREAKIYLSEKQKLIEKYAKRHEEDGDDFKKGDIISEGGSVSLTNVSSFISEINELNNIEIDLGMNKIEFNFDNEPDCTIEEMALLLPLLEVE